MTGVRERAARALADALAWEPYDSQTAATAALAADAVLAVAADVEGIAGVLAVGHCAMRIDGITPKPCSDCRRRAEMVAAHILGRP